MSEAGELLYLRDVAFSADGESALLVGKGVVNEVDFAAVIRFDHAPYASARAATSSLIEDDLFTRLSAPPGQTVDAIQWGFKDKYMMLFSTASNASSATAMLRTYDPVVEEWAFVSSQFMGAGCDNSGGLALVDNIFSEVGALVVCGRNGTSQAYYQEVGGVGEWVLDVIGNISNTSLAMGSPSRDEGLVIANAKLYQFIPPNIDSTYAQFSGRSMQGFGYQPNGRRALVVGKLNPGNNHLLEAMEYRPPLFGSCALGCELTDVSVPAGGFAVADDAYVLDVAWMHHCDGGVVVGGKSTFNSSVGYVFTFQIENGTSCGF
ncbi:MAG: hypothetical protein GY822_18395 [Deltaproteobacteria bacterium]|nr:hypothetical protein [Deltaproteobacteria bacterium]